ncbi:hypothetical protein AVEN_74834-1, partial [Araneus ventricosus]
TEVEAEERINLAMTGLRLKEESSYTHASKLNKGKMCNAASMLSTSAAEEKLCVSCNEANLGPIDVLIGADVAGSLDVLGICDPVEMKSKKENEYLTKMYFEETVRINEDGRYEVSLPWKGDHLPLPNKVLFND